MQDLLKAFMRTWTIWSLRLVALVLLPSILIIIILYSWAEDLLWWCRVGMGQRSRPMDKTTARSIPMRQPARTAWRCGAHVSTVPTSRGRWVIIGRRFVAVDNASAGSRSGLRQGEPTASGDG
jgi:hypothetical protein